MAASMMRSKDLIRSNSKDHETWASRQPNELYNLQAPRHQNYIAQISVAFNIKIEQYLLLGSARHVTSCNRHAPTSRMKEAGKGTSTSNSIDIPNNIQLQLTYRKNPTTPRAQGKVFRHQPENRNSTKVTRHTCPIDGSIKSGTC